jgi:hypothetical protein
LTLTISALGPEASPDQAVLSGMTVR